MGPARLGDEADARGHVGRGGVWRHSMARARKRRGRPERGGTRELTHAGKGGMEGMAKTGHAWAGSYRYTAGNLVDLPYVFTSVSCRMAGVLKRNARVLAQMPAGSGRYEAKWLTSA